MASIHPEKKVIAQTVPGEGAVFDISYHGEELITLNPYWHVLSGWDLTVIGTEQEPAHLLGVISMSPYKELPDYLVPEGMTVVATFDHDPTREELDQFIPDSHSDHLKGGH